MNNRYGCILTFIAPLPNLTLPSTYNVHSEELPETSVRRRYLVRRSAGEPSDPDMHTTHSIKHSLFSSNTRFYHSLTAGESPKHQTYSLDEHALDILKSPSDLKTQNPE